MLEPIYLKLLDITAHFHAVIDYPDDDIDDFEMHSYQSALCGAAEELSRILSTHERSRVLREGLPTAIIGRPNTGKSSLLNMILGYERAIVTEIAGTTRDTVEEKILFGGILLRLIDTAGLRKANDAVEKLGVERSFASMRGAGLVLMVLDGSEQLRNEDHDALRSIPPGVPKLAVINKSDLPQALDPDEISDLGFVSCNVSALTGEGLERLDAEIKKLFPGSVIPPSGELITNMRQAEAISRAKDSINLAISSISASVTPDAVVTDIEAALAAIGEVTGKTMREEVITRIFERFCVGK